jgi:hypothetical protein
VVEYWLTRRLMIQGTAGDRNVDADSCGACEPSAAAT